MSYIMQEKPYDDPDTRLTNVAKDTQSLLSGEVSNWERSARSPVIAVRKSLVVGQKRQQLMGLREHYLAFRLAKAI
jgi:hypothetical protein